MLHHCLGPCMTFLLPILFFSFQAFDSDTEAKYGSVFANKSKKRASKDDAEDEDDEDDEINMDENEDDNEDDDDDESEAAGMDYLKLLKAAADDDFGGLSSTTYSQVWKSIVLSQKK